MTPIDVSEALARNRASFECFLRLASSSHEKGCDNLAVAYAQMAAQSAWHNHPGFFVSTPLANILGELGRKTKQSDARRQTQLTHNPRTVLHVMTTAYVIGGHTRLVKRWIELDSERTHSLVITQQASTAVPRWLLDTVRASGGTIDFLDRKWAGLVSRARLLRRLAQKADLVVLHIHPSDAVPIVAFADKKGIPPVVLMNHADHVFWPGTSTGDVIAHIRQSGVELSCARRGISRSKCTILPIPLDRPRRTIGRRQAKSALGLPEEAVVLLTVASEYKYTRLGDMNFLDAHMPVLERCDRALLLAVGPTERGQWGEAVRRLPGRIRALGAIEDPSPYYVAADIYVDSFPFGSLTSLLEAGSYGLPTISLCPFAKEADVFRPDDLALNSTLLREGDINQYRDSLVRLIENQELRAALGEKTSENILEVHTAHGWRGYVQELYKQAAYQREALNQEMPISTELTQLDSLLVHFHSEAGLHSTVEDVMRSHIEFLPLGRRLALWLQRSSRSRIPLRRALFPDWVRTSLKGLVKAIPGSART